MIRHATNADSEAIARIYNYYISHTIVTFEEQEVTPAEIARRIDGVCAAGFPWLVADLDQRVMGYAYANTWKVRSAFRFTVESSIYLDPQHTGRGLGSMLYSELFRILKERGVHVVIGGIALPNEASVALHEKFGMEKVAHFRQVGYKFGRWIDVGYWQLTL